MTGPIQLPFFPVPADGEAVFSVVGRCIERLGIANQHLMHTLTGQRLCTTLYSALPGYLAKFSGAMPLGHPWTDVQKLINSHTAFPYFTYFHTEEQRAASAALLATAKSTQPISLGLGLSQYRVPVPATTARFCLSCLHEQYSTSGYSYFRIDHQLPGVTHCWEHKKLLSHGCITCGEYPLKGKKLTMPGLCLCGSFAASAIPAYIANTESAYWLARESAYLLKIKNTSFDRRSRLREGILRAGICRGSLVDYDHLAEAIESRFGSEFLQSVNYPTRDKDGTPSAWIRRNLPNHSTGKRLSTIVGLLLLGAAFDSVEAFEKNRFTDNTCSLKAESEQVPTSAPDWAAGLLELLIEHDYRISTCAARLKLTSWKVAIEARNQGIAVPLTPSAVARIGKDRLDAIRGLLRQGVEKDEILRNQGIGAWTLNLIELDDQSLSTDHQKASRLSRQNAHRKCILNFLQDHPDASRQTIRHELAGAYDFMLSNDREWFCENVPRAPRTSPGERSQRNDWKTIDTALATAIEATANQILLSNERPVRITKSMLLKRHRAIQKHSLAPSRFPLTNEALRKFAESEEQYLRRKVTWSIRRLSASGIEISMDSLRREAGVSDEKLKKHVEMVRGVAVSLNVSLSKKSILHKQA